MKTIIYVSMLLLVGFSVIGQEKEPDKALVEYAQKQFKLYSDKFDKDLTSYTSNVAILKKATDLSVKEDLNITKDSTIAIKNRLISYCEKKDNFKDIFKDLKINDSVFKKLDDKCKDFTEKTESKIKRKVVENKGDNNLTYLNGYNFDFSTTNSASGYLGNLNLFFKVNEVGKWYINAGLKKINYAFSESEYAKTQIDNVAKNPLDDLTIAGTKYNKEFNKYTTSSKITSYSGYFQVLNKIFDKNIKNLYWHSHIEFQVSKVNYETAITTVQSIEKEVTPTTDLATILPILNTNYSINNTYFGFYFGTGITGDFKIIDSEEYKLTYFFQGTVGISNIQLGNNSNPFLESDYFKNNVNFTNNYDPSKHFFHLFNTYVSNKVNGLNLLIGTEIRGNFESAPLYIFYVGVNTDLEKIGALFKK